MIFDILLIAFLCFFAWRGKKKGLVAGVLGLFSVIISYVAATFVSKPVFDYFKGTGIYASLIEKIGKLFGESGGEGKLFAAFISESRDLMIERTAEFIGGIIVFVAIFIVILAIFKIFIRLLNSVLQFPGLNFLNKTGGLILGTATGFLLSYIILAVWGVFTLFEMPPSLMESQLVKSMFENNLLFLLIS